MLALTRKYGQSINIGSFMRLSLIHHTRKHAKVRFAINNTLMTKDVPFDTNQTLDNGIYFFIRAIQGKVRFYIHAPREVAILRSELLPSKAPTLSDKSNASLVTR